MIFYYITPVCYIIIITITYIILRELPYQKRLNKLNATKNETEKELNEAEAEAKRVLDEVEKELDEVEKEARAIRHEDLEDLEKEGQLRRLHQYGELDKAKLRTKTRELRVSREKRKPRFRKLETRIRELEVRKRELHTQNYNKKNKAQRTLSKINLDIKRKHSEMHGITILTSAFLIIFTLFFTNFPTRPSEKTNDPSSYKCLVKNENPGFFGSKCKKEIYTKKHWASAPAMGFIFTAQKYKQYLVENKNKEELEDLKIQANIAIANTKADLDRINQELENAKKINDTTPHELAAQKANIEKELYTLRTKPLRHSENPKTDSQSQFILSVLGLAIAFFFQRILEKLFNNKGYAILTVCLLGATIAFFTANYFIFGSIVGGGIMGGQASSS